MNTDSVELDLRNVFSHQLLSEFNKTIRLSISRDFENKYFNDNTMDQYRIGILVFDNIKEDYDDFV